MKKSKQEFQTPYTLKNAWTQGSAVSKLSFVIMGLGNMAHKQMIKGLIFLVIEVNYIFFMIQYGIASIEMLGGLGSVKQVEIWNESKGIYEYTSGDNSLLLLLFGLASIVISVIFIVAWRESIKSGYKAEYLAKSGKSINTFRQDIKSLLSENLHKLLLFFPLAGIVAFNILPLIFMMSMAFTNYSKTGNHLVLFNWVGMDNFISILDMSGTLGQTFWSVLGWTLIWAVSATSLCFIGGLILAMVINRKQTHAKGLWRFCFILSIAIPQFVSLLIMRSLLQPKGGINVLLETAGLINSPLPFLTNATWARLSLVVINMWVGIPFAMLQVTGILQNIPESLYEAAKIDGANAFQRFIKITLPYMLFVMAPYLITQFVGNINNFNVIYLLTGGAPTPVGRTAGKTDLLVTWLYKLTIDEKLYNLGAVIGILTFAVMSVIALITYHNTSAYKDEEGFQ